MINKLRAERIVATQKHNQDLEQLNQEIQNRPVYLPGARILLQSMPSRSELLYHAALDLDDTHQEEAAYHGLNQRVSDFKHIVAEDVNSW